MIRNSLLRKRWVYDMIGDSLLAHASYTKSIAIYDSLIAAKSDVSDMVNRAIIVQIVYGMKAYTQALDEIVSGCTYKDSLKIENAWRDIVFDKEKLSF